MKHRKTNILSIVVFAILLLIGFLVEEYYEITGQFIQLFSIISFVVLSITCILGGSILQSWKKFAQIFIPISIILVILAPEHANKGFGGIGYGLDKEQTTWWLSGIFLVMSLVVIYRNAKIKGDKINRRR